LFNFANQEIGVECLKIDAKLVDYQLFLPSSCNFLNKAGELTVNTKSGSNLRLNIWSIASEWLV